MDQSVGSPREFSAGDFVKAMIIEGCELQARLGTAHAERNVRRFTAERFPDEAEAQLVTQFINQKIQEIAKGNPVFQPPQDLDRELLESQKTRITEAWRELPKTRITEALESEFNSYLQRNATRGISHPLAQAASPQARIDEALQGVNLAGIGFLGNVDNPLNVPPPSNTPVNMPGLLETHQDRMEATSVRLAAAFAVQYREGMPTEALEPHIDRIFARSGLPAAISNDAGLRQQMLRDGYQLFETARDAVQGDPTKVLGQLAEQTQRPMGLFLETVRDMTEGQRRQTQIRLTEHSAELPITPSPPQVLPPGNNRPIDDKRTR